MGFVTVRRHYENAGEIHVMGVLAERPRRGIERSLMLEAEQWLRARGVRWLQVMTLRPSREDEGYACTRAFYQAMGFEPLEGSESRWPGNPSLQMIKRLDPPRAH